MVSIEVTAQDWFSRGKRILYDFQKKQIVKHKYDSNVLSVFQLVEQSNLTSKHWLTMLPGFPDGSFGWVRTESYLKKTINVPRLYVEYIGQGDSDKPDKYPYSSMERADLIEAHWESQEVKSTFMVTFDYSSLAALELLRRQQERIQKGEELHTRITKVLFINGGLFADAHSHPYLTTPLLKTAFGRMGTQIAQKSPFAFNLMMKDLWSKEYNVTKKELTELFEVITRRNGALFMSNAAGFVDEHKQNAKRWDLLAIYQEMHADVSFHIMGSEQDQFEPNQIVKAKEWLGQFGVDIQILPGGHMTTSEYPDLLAEKIQQLLG